MRLKTVVVVCAAIGAGLAILASALTGNSWYNSRRWDTAALQATFDHLDESAGNRIEFYYQLQNNTAADYYVDINSQPTLMAILKKRHPFSPGYEVLVLQHPIAVPAEQRGLVRISFGTVQREGLKAATLATGQGHDDQRLLGLVHQEFGNLDGFILYDLRRQIRIDFPKAW
jgi:hypothetical protein